MQNNFVSIQATSKYKACYLALNSINLLEKYTWSVQRCGLYKLWQLLAYFPDLLTTVSFDVRGLQHIYFYNIHFISRMITSNITSLLVIPPPFQLDHQLCMRAI